jgi:hypothetical protein
MVVHLSKPDVRDSITALLSRTKERDKYDPKEEPHPHVYQSSIGHLGARDAHVDQSAIARLEAGKVTLSQSAAGAVIADQARLSESSAAVVVSRKTTVNGTFSALLHIGPVKGNMQTVVTPQSAAVLGVSVAAIVLLATWIRRRDGARKAGE